MKKIISTLLVLAMVLGSASIFVACEEPEIKPTEEPTTEVTEEPTSTVEPTAEPTVEPTVAPTTAPTAEPTVEPTEEPTTAPTEEPTTSPTEEPTTAPTEEPTTAPTEESTVAPTEEPTTAPTTEPTVEPTEESTTAPTEKPTTAPTEKPTTAPTEEPTIAPTEEPATAPTEEPTVEPTEKPTTAPTEEPTTTPSENPTTAPTDKPAEVTTEEPTEAPDPIYSDGGKVTDAGPTWMPNSFAQIETVIDESKATLITAEELLAILSVRENGLTEENVYIVNGVLTLSSESKYYGNFASVIVPDGIVIEGSSEIVVKQINIKGSITIKSSSDVTFFKLALVGGNTAITIDESCDDVAFKSCRITASDTGVESAGNLVTFYQSYISAPNAINSSGDDLSVHSSDVIAINSAIASSGASPIIRNNNITLASDGIGIYLHGETSNALVALNVISTAQTSIKVTDAFNSVVLLNSAISIIGEGNTNLYVVENKLGGRIKLRDNKYLLCDGNTFTKDKLDHTLLSVGNTEYNGDNLHDVNARVEYGANEDLLPHTNKDLFVGMERLSKVKDVSLTKGYNINKYIRNGAKNGDKVIIPPGAYVSPSRLALASAHSNTTVYAYGVYHEAVEYGNTIQLAATSNFTFKGITIGYVKQSSGQIYVLDKLSKRDMTLLVVAAAGYDKDFGKSNPDVYSTSYTDMFHPGEYTCWKGIGSSYEVVQKNPDGTMVIKITGTTQTYGKIEKGDIWACRMAGSNMQSIFIYNSTNFFMKDCVIYGYAAGLAITATTIGGNLQLERVHNTVHSPYVLSEEEYNFYKELEETYEVDLEISIDDQGRHRGSIPRVGSVDATHVNGTTDGISATSCLFESMCDDGSNQRGNSSRLHKLIKNDDGTTTLVYKGTISETYYWLNQSNGATANSGTQTSNFRAGDKIFVYASNGKILCDTVALTGATQYSNEKYHMMTVNYTYNGQPTELVYSCYLYAVTVSSDAIEWVLDEDGNETDEAVALEGYNLMDNSYKMNHKVLVDNITLNSCGFVFDNVLVQHTRSRGILVKTRDAVVKNCTFRDLAMTGVLLSVETTWGESSVPQNVLVQNCLFDKTSCSDGSENTMKYAPIAIEGLGELSDKVTVSENTLPCKNITIIGNKFVNNTNNYCITMSAAQGITIKDNVFCARPDDTAKKFGKAIFIKGCMNVDISGNTYSEFADGDVTKAIVANNYKGLTGSDVKDIIPSTDIVETDSES